MEIDALVAEIGSTTTVVNAFDGLDTPTPRFLGQGVAPTTVLDGDVTIGLRGAIEDLRRAVLGGAGSQRPNPDGGLTWREMLASSSAAGGLKMTVHGLVYDMTVKAAREAALGAGAVLRFITAGKLQDSDLEEIRRIGPNIILLAGGVDYGERATPLFNAGRLAELKLKVPVIFAGNVAARDEVVRILEGAGTRVVAIENVYPRIDELDVEPARRAIQKAFEEHIVSAPGMEKVRELVTGTIIPTPGAVMNAAQLLAEEIGDLMVLDVGGATTDVHSVTAGSEEIQDMLVAPEPFAKRTVEGDLGVFVNAAHVAERIGWENLSREVEFDAREVLAHKKAIPTAPEEIRLAERLAEEAIRLAVKRHAGQVKYLYGPTGRTTVAEGKDLTRVRWIIGTGGPLTRLPGGRDILEKLRPKKRGLELLPGPEAEILIDRFYIMASLGVLASRHPRAALTMLRESLGLFGESGPRERGAPDAVSAP